LKISTERGTFVVYNVDEEVLDDWHTDLNEAIQKAKSKDTPTSRKV
jgi:hypothetical protein